MRTNAIVLLSDTLICIIAFAFTFKPHLHPAVINQTPLYPCRPSNQLLLIRTRNQNLDALASFNTLQRFLGLFKLHSPSNQLLNIHLPLADQLNSQLVISTCVPETSLRGNLLYAHCHDGECNVRLAHSTLHVHASPSNGMNRGLDRRLRA
jgi:hypothetical protein